MPRRPAPGLAVRRVLAHWSNERATLRQGVSALTICVTVTLFAGIILGAMEGVLEDTPGLLVLVPSAIGMRGAIFGALAARLGTGMLTGQFTTSLRRGSFTAANVEAALLLSIIAAAATAALAWGASALFGLQTIDVLQLVIVSEVGAVVASVVVLGGLLIVAALGAIWLGLRNPSPLTRRVMRESLPVLGYAAVMGILAGTVLETRLETLVTDPALLVAVPPFIASSGALGGILSARLSSHLHVGLIEPARGPDAAAWLEGSLTAVLAIVGFTVVGLATWIGAAAFGIAAPPAWQLVLGLVSGGLLATVLLFFVGYYAATASYRFGLDPDNSSIPIVTSSMDFLGILCLVTGIALVGLG